MQRTLLRVVPLQAVALTVLMNCAAPGKTSTLETSAPPILQIRLASDTPTPGFDVRDQFNVDGRPVQVFLTKTNVVSDPDIIRARTRPGPDGIIVQIVLTDEGADRLRAATAANIGKLMAVIAHGRLAAAATIVQSIATGNSVSLGLSLTAEVADSVRSRVAMRWPQAPR